ncbi:glutathione S-transferase A-like isoform X3 [Anarhichas minor]|uniref:glutathione S-transferase A-like isoform X3 n=1 Tax=Anarhichas minor TaxID=65739 RepID=UPI003F732D66
MGWDLIPPIHLLTSYIRGHFTHSSFTPDIFQLFHFRHLLSGVAVHSTTMAKDMTLLWGSGSPPCWRVMIALEEKNLQGYNQKLLSFEKGEHKSKEVMDMNPRGQLPALKCGTNVLNESLAACLYLESQYKSQGNKLIPDCPAEQAMMYQRMFEGLTFSQKMADVIYYTYKVPEGERHDSAVKRNTEALTTEIKLWEGYLQKVNLNHVSSNEGPLDRKLKIVFSA